MNLPFVPPQKRAGKKREKSSDELRMGNRCFAAAVGFGLLWLATSIVPEFFGGYESALAWSSGLVTVICGIGAVALLGDDAGPSDFNGPVMWAGGEKPRSESEDKSA